MIGDRVMKLVGYSQTIERGDVEVWRDARGFHFVCSPDARDAAGQPAGLREAPIGIELAARGQGDGSIPFRTA